MELEPYIFAVIFIWSDDRGEHWPFNIYLRTAQCFNSTGQASLDRYCWSRISNRTMHALNGNISVNRQLKMLKLGHINVRGNLKNQTKFADLCQLLDDHKPDILGMSEINHDHRDSVRTDQLNYTFIPGHTYSLEKTRVGVLVKRGINFKVMENIMKKLPIPCVWLELKVPGQKVAVVNIYREFQKWRSDDADGSNELKFSIFKVF